MSKEPELKARDKVVVRMTREGAVEENLTAGTEQRVSKRLEEAELVKPAETVAPSEALSPEEQKKVQMRRQQRQFQVEHAEDNDTQPPSETSVTEEKRAENSPQNVPEPLPSETPFKPPTIEQHGVSSHTGTVIAETVVTHKLRKTSAVEAVDADAILTQAAETASAKPVSDDAAPPTKRMQKLERKSEKAHERLDAAREKLPTHKVLKKERVFDEETGKGKTRLHFEDELKKPKSKGKLQFEADKTVRKVGDTLASGIHGKIHEVEQENSAVEAAHKTEIAAETAADHCNGTLQIIFQHLPGNASLIETVLLPLPPHGTRAKENQYNKIIYNIFHNSQLIGLPSTPFPIEGYRFGCILYLFGQVRQHTHFRNRFGIIVLITGQRCSE